MRKDEVSRSDSTLPGLYGQNRFDDAAARDRLPAAVYRELREVQAGRKPLELSCAEVVAAAMKDWAMERGATHYTHWFQPLTGRTAEKHDSFLRPGADGRPILEFSGKELIKGESDASSFPSGGLRATFEARGYTAWDVTSPAFIKEDASGVTLYVPTAFVSYRGEALDGKVPLLRSMEAVSAAVTRLLRALGWSDPGPVQVNVGPEQEYFLVDAEAHARRPDLVLTRRTLFGCASAKGQELDDHYFGQIGERVLAFMSELNRELWRCGVPARTQHKEVAPAQFEIACSYQQANLAADSNQLVMESLHRIAERHGLVALLHEKPFARVNGSGKHVNWSVQAGERNLLDPAAGDTAFLLFLAAVVEAVDLRAPQLRAAAASAGNDLRLGANEAPPAIVSVYLGKELEAVLDSVARGEAPVDGGGKRLEFGMTSLPALPADSSDRNRTSPFAFTGNKFEFRMVPSGDSISLPVTTLNAAVAETLGRFAAAIEGADDPERAAREAIARSWAAHRRVVFDGNGYSKEWKEEAARRGLPDLPTTVDALEASFTPDAVAMYESVGVFTRAELESRQSVAFELYAKRVLIEAATLAECARRGAIPAATEWLGRQARAIESMRAAGLKADEVARVADAAARSLEAACVREKALEEARRAALAIEDHASRARACRDAVVPAMEALRDSADALERAMPMEEWPYPGYEELLFGVRTARRDR